MRFLTTTVLSAGLLVSTATAQVVGAPSGDAARIMQLEQRIIYLEETILELQGSLYEYENTVSPDARVIGAEVVPVSLQTGTPASGADLSIRLTSVEQSLAALTGQVEQLNFRLEQQRRRIDRLLPEDASMGDFAETTEGPAAPVNSSGAPMDLATGQAATVLPDDADAAYDIAYTSVLAADYDAAEKNLSAFVQKFPDSPQTPEAKFLLGEVYLATGANGAAAQQFLDHVKAYKDDPRSAEAYLKLGTAFTRLDRREDACNILNAGKKKFAGMSDDLRRRYDAERASANCG